MEKSCVHLNKRLSLKWEEKMQIEHRERIQAASTKIDNKQPPIFKHLEFNQKK
jgi:hypothetical protein